MHNYSDSGTITDLVGVNLSGGAFIKDLIYSEKCSLFKEWYDAGDRSKYQIIKIVFNFEKRKACGYLEPIPL